MDVEWCFAPACCGIVVAIGECDFCAGAGDVREGFVAELEWDAGLDGDEVEVDGGYSGV